MSAHGVAEHHPGPGWPFWAPSEDDAAERALDLAGVGPGDRFVDLGCGDGRVLVAAARRGAVVTGVETDAALVTQARAALAAEGLDGEVLQEDIFDHRLDADAVFTYLTPATLQRLTPRLASLPAGARLVTVDFAVPGLVPAAVEGPAHLYRMPPARARRRRRTGWSSAGVLVVAVPDYESLACLEVVHPGGTVRLSVSGDVGDVATFRAGADDMEAGRVLAVDARWGEEEAGTVASGRVEVDGVDPLAVFVLFAEEEPATWELTAPGVRRLERVYASGEVPGTADGLVAAASGG